jgi:hypothetical protein
MHLTLPTAEDQTRDPERMRRYRYPAGISRAWELIGAPEVGITHEIVAMVRAESSRAADGNDSSSTSAGS